LDACTEHTKLLFLCSPGNPTSKAIPVSDIETIAASHDRYKGLIVVDEAYIDFCVPSTSPNGTAVSSASALCLIQKYPNVVVLQTLSKAFGLAAIRCGFAVAAPDIIQFMNNVKAPYNVNELTSRTALEAFEHITELHNHIQSILDQRTKLVTALSQLDYITKVYPSDANFILFRVKSNNTNNTTAYELYKAMADNGVVSRYRGTELYCDECIRVTVGTQEENIKFLQALDKHYHSIAHSTAQ
jgi:histidinol-phosphate aminotransferase